MPLIRYTFFVPEPYPTVLLLQNVLNDARLIAGCCEVQRDLVRWLAVDAQGLLVRLEQALEPRQVPLLGHSAQVVVLRLLHQ